MLSWKRKRNDGVAQLVEHITHKDAVVGSNPTLVTEKNRRIDVVFLFLYIG